MSSIMTLGRTHNAFTSATTAKVRASLRDCSGVMIYLIGATSGAATIREANAASGGTEQDLAVVTEYFTQASGVWTRVTQAAAATVTAVTGGLLAVWIPQGALSDGYSYICATHASGSFVGILGDLNVARKPANLRNLTA